MAEPDERLEDLLLQWEEMTEAGQEVSVEELCRDYPDLADELRRRVTDLREMHWLADLQGSQAPGREPVPGYRLVRLLGRGGCGEVWAAVGPDGSPLALKFVSLDGHAGAFEERALKSLQGIQHPHLLSILGSWQTEEFLVIGMELADRTLLAPGQISLPELLDYLRQAAEGLDYLHDQDIQHRDIKPHNLLLCGGTLKLADFGLARVLTHSVTGHTGSLTVAYAAPEFFEGKTTRHSDQYSLAVTYCQLRGGRLPFEGNPAQVMAGHLHRPPDLRLLPEGERPAVARALAKRPDQRWPTCRAFVEAVAAAKGGGRAAPKRPSAFQIGLLLVSAAILALVLWWPPVAGKQAGELLSFEEARPGRNNVRCVAIEPVGRPVVFSNRVGGPTLQDVETGRVIRRLPVAFGPCVAVAPFENPLGLSGDDTGNVILWNLDTGEEVRRFVGHTSSVSSVAFSPDGQQILSGSCDSTVRLWDRRTGREVGCLRGHRGFVLAVAFDPTGKYALSGSWDGTARLWELDSGVEKRRFEGHSSHVCSVAFSPDGRYAATGGLDRTVRLWEVENGKEVRRLDGHDGQANGLVFWTHDRLIAAGGSTVRVWDLTTGHEKYHSPPVPSTIQSIALTSLRDGTHILIGTEEHGLQVWRLPR